MLISITCLNITWAFCMRERKNLSKMLGEKRMHWTNIAGNHYVFMPMKSNFTAEFYTAGRKTLAMACHLNERLSGDSCSCRKTSWDMSSTCRYAPSCLVEAQIVWNVLSDMGSLVKLNHSCLKEFLTLKTFLLVCIQLYIWES